MPEEKKPEENKIVRLSESNGPVFMILFPEQTSD